MKPELLYDLLNRALTEELGLVVTTNNPQKMSHDLHALTKDNPRYTSIMITIPSTLETLILAKRSVELDEPVGDTDV